METGLVNYICSEGMRGVLGDLGRGVVDRIEQMKVRGKGGGRTRVHKFAVKKGGSVGYRGW